MSESDSDHDVALNYVEDEEETEDDINLDLGDHVTRHIDGTTLDKVKMLTTTCLHQYATDRIGHAETNQALWPPIMLVIFNYFQTGKTDSITKECRPYKRTNLLNERNYVMLELLLNVPIQCRIVYKPGVYINPNEVDEEGYNITFSPHDKSFIEAKILLQDLLNIHVIEKSDLRRFHDFSL